MRGAQTVSVSPFETVILFVILWDYEKLKIIVVFVILWKKGVKYCCICLFVI
jgi:hypothetical protein